MDNQAAEGSMGNQTVKGSKGNQTVEGSMGNQTVEESKGNQTVEGSKGNQTVEGRKGNQTVEDSLEGGAKGDADVKSPGCITVGANDHLRQQVGPDLNNSDSDATKVDREEVMEPDVETKVSPKDEANQEREVCEVGEATKTGNSLVQHGAQHRLETDPEPDKAIQRSNSIPLRKRRHQAIERVNADPPSSDLPTAAVANSDSGGDGPEDENDIEVKRVEIDKTQKKQNDDIPGDEVTMRRTAQETDQRGLDGSNTEKSDSMETERKIELEEMKKAQDNIDAARQSCMDMDYTKEDIDWAVKKYQRANGGSDDYSGCELAEIIEERMDEAPDESHDLDMSHDPDELHGNESPSRRVTTTLATVTDLGHSPDGCPDHIFEIDLGSLPHNKCDTRCKPMFVVKRITP